MSTNDVGGFVSNTIWPGNGYIRHSQQ